MNVNRENGGPLGIALVAALIVGVLVFLGPMLIDPAYAIIWLWFSWILAPIAALIAGTVAFFIARRLLRSPERSSSLSGRPTSAAEASERWQHADSNASEKPAETLNDTGGDPPSPPAGSSRSAAEAIDRWHRADSRPTEESDGTWKRRGR